MLTSEMNEHDHLAKLSHIEYGISNLKGATEILHSLIYNNGDEHHLQWMTDKLLDDVDELSKQFSKGFGDHVAQLRQPVDLAEAAE